MAEESAYHLLRQNITHTASETAHPHRITYCFLSISTKGTELALVLQSHIYYLKDIY